MYASGNAPEGNNVLWAYSDSTGSTQDSIVAQIINLTLEANMIYTLTVNVGDRLDTPNNGYAVRLGYGSSLGSFTLLAQDNNSLALPNGGWVTSTVVYTNLTAIAQPLQIQLVGLKGPGSGNQVNFDNVQLLVTMIPEPSTIFLFVSGLATLYWAWRRRHSRGATGE